MSNIGAGTPLQLLPILMDERGKTLLLALDAFNLLSLELIQNQDCFAEQSPVLESVFLKRRQLCIDIQSSALRDSDSLAALLQTYEIEALPAEFPIAILWDETPISSSIFEIMVKLTGEVEIALAEEAFGVRLVSLTLSKGTIAVSVTPGAGGKANVNVEDSSIAMNPEELIRFASEWEIKPELAFFAKAGPLLLPPFSEETIADIEARVKDTENAQLEAPVPSIVLESAEEGIDELDTAVPEENGQERWQCNQCGAFNQQYTQVCTSCGASTLDVGEEQMPVTREPVHAQQPERREYAPEQQPERKEPIRDEGITVAKWKCRYCTFENLEREKICLQCNKTNAPPEVPEGKKEGWTCEYCTLLNKESARICDACAKTRKDLLPPSPPPEEAEVTTKGYWKCGKCGYQANGPTDIRCYKCKAIKGTPREAKTTGIDDGWMCPVCETNNFSFSKTCLSCRAPKSTEKADKEEPRYEEAKLENGRAALKPGAKTAEPKAGNTWKCERCNIDVEGSRSYCGKCYSLKPTSGLVKDLPSPPEATPSQEEWKCPNCQHVNRRGRGTCLICNIPKSGAEEEKTDQSWICKCGRKNLEHRIKCISCYEKKPLDQPKAAQYDNWTCTECRNSNIYYDAKCRKCGISKEIQPKVPDTDPNEEDMELNLRADPVVYPPAVRADIRNKGTDLESKAPQPAQALDIDMRGKDSPSAVLASRALDRGDTADRGKALDQRWKVERGEAADKDIGIETRVNANKSGVEAKRSYWDCSACHAVNHQSDLICYQCLKPKSEASPRAKEPEPKPRVSNYWTCKGCGKENFKDDIKCYSCKLPKGQVRVEEEKWTCRHCQTKNAEREIYCTKCYRDRQERQVVGKQPPSKVGKQDDGWTCGYCHSVNLSSTNRCSTCHRTSPRKAPLDPEPRAKTCTGCGQVTPQGSSLCSMCERGAKYNSSKSWMCQRCRIAVTTSLCSRCHSSKPRS